VIGEVAVVVVVAVIIIVSGPPTVLKKAMSTVITRKYTCARVAGRANRFMNSVRMLLEVRQAGLCDRTSGSSLEKRPQASHVR
jgi:hypothetical protein